MFPRRPRLDQRMPWHLGRSAQRLLLEQIEALVPLAGSNIAAPASESKETIVLVILITRHGFAPADFTTLQRADN